MGVHARAPLRDHCHVTPISAAQSRYVATGCMHLLSEALAAYPGDVQVAGVCTWRQVLGRVESQPCVWSLLHVLLSSETLPQKPHDPMPKQRTPSLDTTFPFCLLVFLTHFDSLSLTFSHSLSCFLSRRLSVHVSRGVT